MDYKFFHLEEFEPITEPERVASFFRRFFNIPLYSIPIRFKDLAKGQFGSITLVDLGNAVSFNSPEMIRMLSYHDDQYLMYSRRKKKVYWAFALPFGIILSVLVLWFSTQYMPSIKFEWSTLSKIAYNVLLYSVLFMFCTVSFAFFMKISYLLSDSKYADTLCVLTIICLVIQLSYDNILSQSRHRKKLLDRINALARNTILLSGYYFSQYDANRTWAQNHFKHMELYIRERERWVLAPTGTTLDTLRRDFYELARMYIAGDYGSFSWQPDVGLPGDRPRSWSELLASTGIHVLVAVVPLIVMGYLLGESQWVTSAGLQSVVALIFIGWLLIIIDAFLKIGIVDKIVSLGKGIKELKN
jgi:hypothetical protein